MAPPPTGGIVAVSRTLCAATYLYVVGLAVLAMGPRHMLDAFGLNLWWVVVAGAIAVLASALLSMISLLRSRPAGFRFALLMIGIVLASITLLLGSLLALAYATSPGYGPLAAYFLLLALGGLSVALAAVYVPVVAAALLARRAERAQAWESVRLGLLLGLVPAGLAVLLAPRHYQDIGRPATVTVLWTVLSVGLTLGLVLPLIVSLVGRARPLPFPPAHSVALSCGVLLVITAYQTFVLPPDDPSAFAERDSQAVRVIAPPGHPELLREVTGYQQAWDQIRSQGGVPDLIFDVRFDGVVALRPRRPADGESDINVKVAQSPEERLALFAKAANDIAGYYRTNVPAGLISP
ncbi:MAG: hypothetical protein M3Z11_05220 [Candidatus Dormibacteraeota bacterium]|nr:hypothetical protein [Candidatus Dormibacteraeota bacterium]